ncbi:MAG: winged helix DNA-binding domain-containing protein [Flavobacteriales bacterium]
MTLNDIAQLRLNSQQLNTSMFSSPKELVEWMGAMQAQDFEMSKWAIGSRLPGVTEQQVEEALNKGDILRTHVLRPTWHLVAVADIRWLLELTGPRVKGLMKSSNKALGLTSEIYAKSARIIEKALLKHSSLTREELMKEISAAGINTENYRSAHLMMNAELDALVCSGPVKGKKQTYALLEERAGKAKKLSKEEALGTLARKYFSSHSPATIKDFIWWSGLSATEARQALDFVKGDFISETIGADTYWFSTVKFRKKDSVHFLPSFDEFLISYKDRSASIAVEHQRKAYTGNGIFRPVVVANGQIVGTWKRSLKKDKVLLETEYFTKGEKYEPEKAIVSYGLFLGKKPEMH